MNFLDKRMEGENCLVKSDQNITNVSDHIEYDISLKNVDLSKNKIAYLPDEFGNLLNLKVCIYSLRKNNF